MNTCTGFFQMREKCVRCLQRAVEADIRIFRFALKSMKYEKAYPAYARIFAQSASLVFSHPLKCRLRT